MDRQFVFKAISQECDRRQEELGGESQFYVVWLTILIKKVGEVGKAILEADWDQMRAELIQCAAVIVTWLCDGDAK